VSQIEPRQITLASGRAVLIRSAALADAARVGALTEAVWAEKPSFNITAPGELALTVEHEATWIQAHLEDPAQVLLVAEADGAIVGLLNCEAGTRRRLAHTATFGVSTAHDWRDQGLGRALISTLLDWAAAHPQIERLGLTVFSTNARAIHLYASLGFTEEGREYRAIKYADGSYADAIRMYRWMK
jgi:RimJ/RimL family protein N-acetyltransferase